MKDDMRSGWTYFVRPGLHLLENQGFPVPAGLAAGVLAAGYTNTGFTRRMQPMNNREVGFWRLPYGKVSSAIWDPRFSAAAARVCGVLGLEYGNTYDVHRAAGYNDYLAPAIAAFALLNAKPGELLPSPLTVGLPESAFRAVYMARVWPGVWTDGVWPLALDIAGER